MKHKLKATIAALATMAVLAAAMATVALAQSGVDEAWTNDMNQTSYWESRFGADCDKFENHSGTVDASQAVVKDGNYVRVYDPAPTQVLGPVNPANGKHFDPPHSWVMKCKTTTSSTSSTTSSSTSSTTSTTSTSLVTTTTTLPSTTTTEQSTTSTTQPIATTTTSQPSTTSTSPVDSSTTSTAGSTTSSVESLVLPYTGAWTNLLFVLAAGLGLLGGMILYLAKTQP